MFSIFIKNVIRWINDHQIIQEFETQLSEILFEGTFLFSASYFEFSLIIFQFLDSPKEIPCGSSDWLKARILLQKVFQPIINHTNSYNKSRIQFYICLVIHQVSPNFDSTYLHVTVYSIGRHWVQAQWDKIFFEVAFIFLYFYVLTRYVIFMKHSCYNKVLFATSRAPPCPSKVEGDSSRIRVCRFEHSLRRKWAVLSLKFLTTTDFSFDIILHLWNADCLEILNTKMPEQFAFRRHTMLSKLVVIFWFNWQ